MIRRFFLWLGKAYIFELLRGKHRKQALGAPDSSEGLTSQSQKSDSGEEGIGTNLLAIDEELLERSRTQLLFGDWASLSRLDNPDLKDHPDRARLSLMGAMAKLQLGDIEAGRRLIKQAEEWGCSPRIIKQALFSSVHNTLGKAAALGGMNNRAALHFKSSVGIALPGADTELAGAARQQGQLNEFNQLTVNAPSRLS